MRTSLKAITAAVIGAAALAGCSSGASTAAAPPSAASVAPATPTRYSSAPQVVAALKHGGLACTGGDNGAPVVSGASSETQCNFAPSGLALIDVFPGTVSTATVLRNSVSTGTEQIWSDVGPNWWVQTNSAYVKRVQAILGGRVIAGPWHPATTRQSSSSSPAPTPTHSQAPKIIAKYSGSGIENTPPFTTPSDWHLSWYYSCANFGQSGNFIVTEYNTDGSYDFNGTSVNELGTGKGPVATYVYGDAGQHYLSINSECDWQVAVVSG